MDSKFGDLSVHIVSSDTSDHSVTHTTVELKRKNVCRRVSPASTLMEHVDCFQVEHIMYREWPDHSIPITLRPFIAIWDFIRRHGTNGNVTVHCAGGVGKDTL